MMHALAILALMLASCATSPAHPALSHVARMGDRTPSEAIEPGDCFANDCQLIDYGGDNDPTRPTQVPR